MNHTLHLAIPQECIGNNYSYILLFIFRWCSKNHTQMVAINSLLGKTFHVKEERSGDISIPAFVTLPKRVMAIEIAVWCTSSLYLEEVHINIQMRPGQCHRANILSMPLIANIPLRYTDVVYYMFLLRVISGMMGYCAIHPLYLAH